MKPHFGEVRDEIIILNLSQARGYSDVAITDAPGTGIGGCCSRLGIELQLCVCERERDKEGGRQRERERERGGGGVFLEVNVVYLHMCTVLNHHSYPYQVTQ